MVEVAPCCSGFTYLPSVCLCSIPVWEIQFHRHHPSHLFTCSQDSSLWHWDASPSPSLPSSSHPTPSSSRHPHTSRPTTDHTPSSTPWLSSHIQKGKFNVTYLLHDKLPVNSFDVESKHVVCGTDSEMLFLVPNLTFR